MTTTPHEPTLLAPTAPALTITGVEVSALGAVVTGAVDRAALVPALAGLSRWESSARWVVGDLVLALEAEVGQAEALTAVSELGYSQAWLATSIQVARHVAHDHRRASLSWSHHEVVAGLEPVEQSQWLAGAESFGWTVKELGRRVAEWLDRDQGQLDGVDGGPVVDPWRVPPVVARRIGEILAVDSDAWVLVHPRTGEVRAKADGA